MPILAFNPILFSMNGLTANSMNRFRLTITKPDFTEYVLETLWLRANADGKIENFDLSPLIAGFMRKNFNADKINPITGFDTGLNQFEYILSKDGNTQQVSRQLLFGVGAANEAELTRPYLLRRNQSAIHVYEGLPGSFSQFSKVNMVVYGEELQIIKAINGGADGRISTCLFEGLGIPVGRYYLAVPNTFIDPTWQDKRVWHDSDVWLDDGQANNAVFYPLIVHPSPADCLRSGAKIYVRYWNSRGAWSYTLLNVLYNDLKAKTEYADSWRLDAKPVNGRILGDRVQTDKEITYTMTAGRDGLDRLDVDELRDMQRSWCVQVWDIDEEVWRDCYVQDATTRNSGGCAQEMTFTLEMPHEYTFTR